MKLFQKITTKEHLLAAFEQVKEKWFDPQQEYYAVQAAGIDGLSLQEFEKNLDAGLEACRDFLIHPGKDFYPQILTLIPKKDPGKFREIYLMTVRDKVIHKAIAGLLEGALDRHFYPNLYAFRRGKYYGSMAAARKVRKILQEAEGKCYVLKADISEYFDSIDPQILLAQFREYLPEEREIHAHLERFVHQRRLVKGILHSPIRGVPTGSSLSPLSANLYLNELDREMFRRGFQYLRYCDDLLLLSPDRREIEAGRKIIEDVLHRHRLKLAPQKTFLYGPHQTFDYLGYQFADGGVHVGDKSIQTFREWIQDILPRNRYRDFSRETPEQRKELLRKIIIDLNTGKLTESGRGSVDKHQIPWIRSFPVVNHDRRFKEMDRFLKNRIRMLITGRTSAKNYQLVPEAWFRELGYKSLTGAFYRFVRRRSLAPYFGWRRYFGSNLLELGTSGKKKSTSLGRKLRQWKEQIQFFKKAIRGEI